MIWEYKIIVAKVLKGQAKLKFDTDEASQLLNELGRAEWELVDVTLVGTEAMYTIKRQRQHFAEHGSIWK